LLVGEPSGRNGPPFLNARNGPPLQPVVSISVNVASNNTLQTNVNRMRCLNPFVSVVALGNDLLFCQCNTHAIKQVLRTTQIIVKTVQVSNATMP